MSTLKVCADCGTEASRVAGRRRGSGYWWCWRCEKAIRPVEATTERGADHAE